MTGPDPRQLANEWTAKAATLHSFGSHGPAEAVEQCARQLVAWWEEAQAREVTTEEAEEASGYTRSALEQMKGRGLLTAAGRPGAPRYIAGELPRKAGRRPRLRLATGEPDLAAEVLLGRERTR